MAEAPFGYGPIRASLTDIGLFIGRLTIGGTLLMHGWQKFSQMGYGGVVEMLGGVGAPFPQVSAALVILLEVVGSAAFIAGFFTRVMAVLIAVNMVGAMLLIHLPSGFFVSDGGYELVTLIGGTALIYALSGPGRIALDALVLRGFRRRGRDGLEPMVPAETADSAV